MNFAERRQGPRTEVLPRPEFRLARRVRVRLVDISLGGALVASDERLGRGTVGQLRLPLGRGRFEAAVVVKREEVVAEPPAVLLGAAIVSAGAESRDVLEQFLRSSK
jgi:c-di-GMP-binding flagellar brake protein YcgR